MKLQPIFNPHTRIGQITKKTKVEEKDELIATTKSAVLEKYGKKIAGKKAGGTTQMTGSGQNFQDKGNFQLEEKISPQNLGIKLLSEGYMQAYIDFFYLTQESTPSYIEPSPQLVKEYQLNKRIKQKYAQTEDNLIALRDSLIQAELCWRDQDSKNCFKTYLSVAEIFEHLNDWETASYFHKRCLDISIEFKYIEGEAKSYKGLGIC